MIGPGITIRGNVSGDEDLTIEGRVEGTINLKRDLVVAPSAELAADVEAHNVGVGGRITGNIVAGDLLSIESGAVVVGDIATPRLVIEDGARFKGRVTMEVDIPDLEGGSRRRR